jgi:ABC-type amino acid transport substrate-binding protein
MQACDSTSYSTIVIPQCFLAIDQMYSPRRHLLRQTYCAAVAAALLPLGSVALAEPTLRTLTPGVLRIGTYFTNPPFEYVSEGASRLELQPQFVDTRWEVIMEEMAERRFDCIVGGITITPGRRRLLAWSAPFMTTTLSLIVDAARSPGMTGFADLKGRTIGVQAATTDDTTAVAMRRAGKIGNVRVYQFSQLTEAIADLRAGRIAAVMKVSPAASWFVRKTPGLRILGQIPDDPQPLGIGFNRANSPLVNAVDGVLAKMQRDGGYATIAKHWRVS